MTHSTKKKTQKKNKIPVIPFSFEEVYALTQYQAPRELWNRLRVWKASNDYQFIKSLDSLVVNGRNNNRNSSSKKELEQVYTKWLIGLESDKFKALSEIALRGSGISLDIDPYQGLGRKKDEDDDEEKIGLDQKRRDMLNFSGIL